MSASDASEAPPQSELALRAIAMQLLPMRMAIFLAAG
jgi:hypothetical protein